MDKEEANTFYRNALLYSRAFPYVCYDGIQMQETYREFPNMTFEGIQVGAVGKADIMFLRTMRIRWQDLEELIIPRPSSYE